MTRVAMAVHSDYLHDRRVRNEATALVQAGYDVTVLCAVDSDADAALFPPKFESEGVQVITHRLERRKGKLRFVEMMRTFRKTLGTLSFEMVHAHDLDTLLPCYLAAKESGAKLVYDSHELYTESVHVGHRPFVRGIWKTLESRLIGRADAVITVCQGIADELQYRYDLPRKPAVVRNFSNPPLMDHPVVPEALASFRDRHAHLMLYQGYIQRGRGLFKALQALKEAPDWGLVICGRGPLETDLRRSAAHLGVEERVLWLGNLELDALYGVTKTCDLGLCLIEPVSLSYFFALPNKLIEYVQAGIPVVGSDLPEIRRIIHEYKIGWVTESTSDLHSLLKSFDSLKNDKSLSEGMISAAQSLNWHREKQALLDVYAPFRYD